MQSAISLTLAGLAGAIAWMGYKNISRVRDSYTGTAPSDD